MGVTGRSLHAGSARRTPTSLPGTPNGEAIAPGPGSLEVVPIPSETTIGAVVLTVRRLEPAREFYERVVGLRTLASEPGVARLGSEGGPALVELVGDPDAPPRPSGATGLFHQAFLVPERVDLASALRRVVDAGWRLSGASDHLVSEALYLDDPEGNGIEIYWDRARETWQADERGIRMATLPLDLRALVEEELRGGDGAVPAEVTQGTRIGHVHLNVADLAEAEAFYVGVLGFEVTVRGYPGALFVSAGGYHHHIGLNTWLGEGAPPSPPGSAGLREFEVVLPDRLGVEEVGERLISAGEEVERSGGEIAARDPSGNRVVLRSAT
jgi:catechol 2,3-dioxygenase